MAGRVTSYELYCCLGDYSRWYYLENVTLEQALVETSRIAHIFKQTPYIDLTESSFKFEDFKVYIEKLFSDEIANCKMVIIKLKGDQLNHTMELEELDYLRKGVIT